MRVRRLGGGRRATAPEATGDRSLLTYGPSMARLRTRVVASLMLLGVAACGDSGSDGDDTASSDESTTTTEADVDETTTTAEPEQSGEEVTAVPDLELLEEGTEPRVELRYAFEEGSVVSLTNSTTIDQTIGGQSTG